VPLLRTLSKKFGKLFSLFKLGVSYGLE
jgi:hypothetical protein